MLLKHLASSPDTPPAVLDRLYQHTLTMPLQQSVGSRVDYRDMRIALASNPVITTERVRELANLKLTDGAAYIMRAALARPGLSANDAIDLVGQDRRAATLLMLLETVNDPSGAVATYVAEHAHSTQLWNELLRNEHTPDAARYQSVERVAAYRARYTKALTTSAARAVEQRVLAAGSDAEHADALAWARTIAATTADHVLRDRLVTWCATHTTRTLEPAGSTAWYGHPRTTTSDVLEYLNFASDERTWRTAVTHHRDPTGTLANAAMTRYPSTAVARAVARATTSVEARQRAALALVRTDRKWDGVEAAVKLARTGDRAFAIELVAKTGYGGHIDAVAQRADLTAEDLTVLDHARRHPDGVRREHSGDWLTSSDALWGVYLATHPVATPAQREHGRRLAADEDHHDGMSLNSRDVANFAAQTVGLDPYSDPASPARVGALLPLAMGRNMRWYIEALPGMRWLIGETVAASLPASASEQTATVLRALSEDFPGTLGELLTVAKAVGLPA